MIEDKQLNQDGIIRGFENSGDQMNDRGRQENGNSLSAPGEANGQPKRTSNRGFAAMDPAKQREIAKQGGRAAHEQGVAHQWTSEEARLAGRKGGQNSGSKRSADNGRNQP